jgi:N4-(beta-N-acetylglucosaminyl)-L-asparaginase
MGADDIIMPAGAFEEPSRRVFLAGSAAVAAMGITGQGQQRDAVLVSTWDFGAAANRAAFARMQAGGGLIDAIEAGARVTEADPDNHSVGGAGYPDRDGHVTLDAIIMDDAGHVGAVAALEGVTHAISVARAVMDHSPHTLLVGAGARHFAHARGFATDMAISPAADRAWRAWLKTERYAPVANRENVRGGALDHDTIGILARDRGGRLAGGCTTSGMAFKMHGRVGDSPQAGAGLFVDRGVGAATATGLGEEVTRIAGSARVVASMRAGAAPAAACREAIAHLARLRGSAIDGVQVAFLALSPDGRVGAFSLLPGFTYAVTDSAGITTVHAAPSLRN